jgi:hypothetical protein
MSGVVGGTNDGYPDPPKRKQMSRKDTASPELNSKRNDTIARIKPSPMMRMMKDEKRKVMMPKADMRKKSSNYKARSASR